MDDRDRIAIIDRETGGGTVIRYQLADNLGSSSIELDDKSNIISYEEYHPFGTTSYQKHNTNISQKRYKYTGKERDNETGMYYYGARYYAAWTCRFVSVDPLADEYLEWSPYVYCADNPIKYIDPDGRTILGYKTKFKMKPYNTIYGEGIWMHRKKEYALFDTELNHRRREFSPDDHRNVTARFIKEGHTTKNVTAYDYHYRTTDNVYKPEIIHKKDEKTIKGNVKRVKFRSPRNLPKVAPDQRKHKNGESLAAVVEWTGKGIES